MGDPSSPLPSFPSNSEAFNDFERNSQLPQIPRYQAEIAESDISTAKVIRCHSSLLAFQPRTRKRINATKPKKKKPLRRKNIQVPVSSDDERCAPHSIVSNDAQATGTPAVRRRSTRRAVTRDFQDFVTGGVVDETLSDDDDFM